MNGRIIHGDALKELAKLPDESVDYFLTSVPFKEDEFGGSSYWDNMDVIVKELTRITSKAGFMFQSSTKMKEMFKRYKNIHRVLIWGKAPSCYSFRYEPIFVWQKEPFKVNKYIFKDFWSLPPIPYNSNTYENPFKLYKEILQLLPKGKVIDPFCGTGTTKKVAEYLGHEFLGIEINGNAKCFDKNQSRLTEVIE